MALLTVLPLKTSTRLETGGNDIIIALPSFPAEVVLILVMASLQRRNFNTGNGQDSSFPIRILLTEAECF